MFDAADPKAFRRASRGTYSAAFYELPEAPEDALKESYPMLVRTLSNVVLLRVPGEGVWFTTMERGTYHVADDPEEIYERLEPLATSRLVIDNEWVPDLEPELWDGDEVTADIGAAGRRLDELDLLPSPFPVEEYLSGRDLRHVMRLYSVGGLSYGNLSARKDETRFWMSASGVDKSQLEAVGRDILMVKDFDDERGVIVLSVPPGIEPRRVSVDAIEHWMIYQAHPDVGAILHVHAWMEGIPATDVNYPCGTQELAVAVADLVAARAGSRARGHRPAEPRHHLHRGEPLRDPRPGGAEGAPPGPYDLRRSTVKTASAGATTRSFAMHQTQIASITNSCTTTR